MSVWDKVSTLDELKDFLTQVGGFHDGVLKEVHWVNGDVVEEALNLMPARLSSARMLIQRQWRNPSAVELYFENVWRLSLNTVDFIYSSNARPELSTMGAPKELLVLQMEESEIVFERMLWRDASEWMGSDVRFGEFNIPNWDDLPAS